MRQSPADRALRWLIDRAAILCVAQLVVALIAVPFVLSTIPTDLWAGRGLRVLEALVYGSVGVLLRYVVHAEERARTLGFFLLCSANVFAVGSLSDEQALSGTLLTPLLLVFAIKVDALTPYLAWRFASDFPRVPDSRRSQRFLIVARGLSLALSMILMAACLLAIPFGDATGPLSLLARSGRRSIYFALQYVLVLVAFVTLALRARRASTDERRRVSMLVGGLLLGALPTIVWIILWTLIPRFGDLVPLRYAGWIIYPSLLATPAVAAYAVVARRAFGVALLVRRAIEHALTRYSVLIVLLAPAIALVLELYRHRGDSVADALSLGNGWTMLFLLAIAILGLRSRRTLLDRIDRAFFRERYDARHVTAQLVDDCRWVGTRDELASLLARGLDQAMHVERVQLFLLNARAGRFDPATGHAQSLAVSAPLSAQISAAEESFDFDLDADGRASGPLSPSDTAWLTDACVRCLVPLHDASSNLLGFLALGAKRSGLPFTREDRSLLKSVARAAELTLGYHKLFTESESTPQTSTHDGQTRECASCGLVAAEEAVRCPACSGTLIDCLLPALVGGNLKVVGRVGGGGMGTVYRGLDMDLRRSVALKTLPYVSPDAAARLRREAHIMATLEHEAVASVYAVQSWQGKPIIVYEFLADGTLADRIARGPLPVTEVLSIGLAIAAGLSAIHDAGLLHGDIKPSNIGFTSNGRPKLLDFGIAAPIHALGERPEHPTLAGTMAYLAPEVARGGIPTFDAEVWSLTMSLFEAITGRQPMIGDDFPETMRRVRAGQVPLVSHYVPDASPELDSFFERAFSHDGRRHLSTAPAMRSALARVRERVPIAT